MIRLQLKDNLIMDCVKVFQTLSIFKKVLPRCFLRITKRSILRDYRKGLKLINKSCEVFVELPKYKKETTKSYSLNKSDGEKEVVVTDSKSIIEYEEKLLIDGPSPEEKNF